MTTKYDISKLGTHKVWRGSHTKHIVEVLAWDGTVDSGGTAYVRQEIEGPYPYSYRAMNLVDLLQVYVPMPNFPEMGAKFTNEYDKCFVVHRVFEGETLDTSWIIFYPEVELTGGMFKAMVWKDFRNLYKEL
ncbi:hypothetical protein HWB05_gp057 [Streptomyces phage BRock]|uniref:Uncharacterized protein n=1 Tax=Streptomyces phage BRock TaxID=1913591 RepID=A0A1J0GVV6_9CAUD|nr:hypothetical protein HWB05_gp057 [Streptomyces phage BRock]APC46319.1 hypothetical protein [Streptomyces phage BRock]